MYHFFPEFFAKPVSIKFYGYSVDEKYFDELQLIPPCPENDIKDKLTAISYKLNDISDNLANLFEPGDHNKIDNVLQKAITTLQSQITCQKLADIYFDLNFLDTCGLESVISTDVKSIQKDLISVINSFDKNNITEIKLPPEIESLVKLCLKTIKKSIELKNTKLGDLNKLPRELLKRFSNEQLQGKVSSELLGQLFKTHTKTTPVAHAKLTAAYNKPTSNTLFPRLMSCFLNNDTRLDILISLLSNKQLLLEDNKNKPLLLEDNKLSFT